jgi:transcriptional regulator with XRE-family HTH domain
MSAKERGRYFELKPIIGGCLEFEMQTAGILTQTELARKSGVSKSTINAIMKGRVTRPDVWTMARLAKACKSSIERLLSHDHKSVWNLSQQEQKIIDVYRNGSHKKQQLLDLVVEWDAEDRPSPISEPKGGAK